MQHQPLTMTPNLFQDGKVPEWMMCAICRKQVDLAEVTGGETVMPIMTITCHGKTEKRTLDTSRMDVFNGWTPGLREMTPLRNLPTIRCD